VSHGLFVRAEAFLNKYHLFKDLSVLNLVKLIRLMPFASKSPVIWGILATIGFYSLVQSGPLDTPLIRRYLATHPVEYMETALFAVGLAALVLKAIDVAGQYLGLSNSPLAALPKTAHSADDCQSLLDRLASTAPQRKNHYFIRRLLGAIEHVHARGSAESLDDELKYMADSDSARLHASYGLFRVIVWAIPILGFLGTVIGITMALNGVDLQAPDQSMVQVLTGLGLKFDTTALALTLSMVLMFVHFFVDRAESSLLEKVDGRVNKELAGRFSRVSAGPDGQVAPVRRMAETMLRAMESLAQRHADWQRLQQSQVQGIQVMESLQTELSRQTEIIQQAVKATGEVTRLEDALNRNLAALAGAKHFEQTVMSLAAAINLLNARLSETPINASPIRLETPRRTAKAA
jgi:biopolymer transport protein ExbB/TolQ